MKQLKRLIWGEADRWNKEDFWLVKLFPMTSKMDTYHCAFFQTLEYAAVGLNPNVKYGLGAINMCQGRSITGDRCDKDVSM
jgi:hypothetical protein